MNTFITLLLLSISLSMDAFSISIFLGTIINKKSGFTFVILVGLFHFFMPILGAVFGYKIASLVELNGNLILGIILLLLSIQIFINLYKEENELKKFDFYELVLFSFSVAIDSFSLGFALSFKENFIIMSSFLFSISSMFFTYIGLLIGKYSSNLLGIWAKTLGGLFLLILSLFHLIRF